MAEPTGPVLVVIPTYEERDNLRPVLARLHDAVPDAHVLVVDDASPDGTGELADELAAADPRINVLHRAGKAGLGAAYLAGFDWALQRDYQVIVQMDADGSHPPEALGSMFDALGDADLVLGSRYVPGGELRNWPVRREWLSRGANFYTRVALGVPVRDMTAGYRAFRRQVLAELDLAAVASQGYCFQIDMAWRAVQAGFRVAEVPITFTERERGRSKMSGAIVGEAFFQVARWGTRRVLGRGGSAGAPVPPTGTAPGTAAGPSAAPAAPRRAEPTDEDQRGEPAVDRTPVAGASDAPASGQPGSASNGSSGSTPAGAPADVSTLTDRPVRA